LVWITTVRKESKLKRQGKTESIISANKELYLRGPDRGKGGKEPVKRKDKQRKKMFVKEKRKFQGKKR